MIIGVKIERLGLPQDNEVGGRILGDSKRSLYPTELDSLVTNLIIHTTVKIVPIGW